MAMSSTIAVIFLFGFHAFISINVRATEILGDCSKCGITSLDSVKPMIVGGETVKDVKAYPWMVNVMKYGQKFCGGAIISDRYILTAAHCVEGEPANKFQIGFLTATPALASGPAIERIISHPSFSSKTFVHDIALIELKEKITCGAYKNPACLPPSSYNLPIGTEMTVTGWGYLKASIQRLSNELQETKVHNTDFQKCMVFGHKLDDSKHFICLVGKDNKSSSCMGDSGGPLILRNKNRYFTMGVTSHGSGNCDIRIPFLYASVSNDINWITEVSGVKPAYL